MSRLLRNRHVPYLMGFDPMMQFMDEEDVAKAIVLATEKDNVSGVYNIAGPSAIPWKKAIELVHKKAIPVPHYLAYPLVHHLTSFGVGFPMHLMDYFRYPVIITDKKFRQDTDFQPEFGIQDIFAKFQLRRKIH
jgi:UDP-glucose 4-epimerase